jgi:hypothetical protein
MKNKYLEDGRNRVLRNYTPFRKQKTTLHNHRCDTFSIFVLFSQMLSPSVFLTKILYVFRISPYEHHRSMQDLRFSRRWLWIMPTSKMLRRVVLLYANVSKERVASIFRAEAVTRAKKDALLSVPANWSHSANYRLRLSSLALLLIPWKWRWYFSY